MSVIKLEDVKHMLFGDIETVAEYASYDQMPEEVRELWDKVSKRYLGDDYESKSLAEKDVCYKKYAGLHGEFGKIVSAALGVITYEEKFQNPKFLVEGKGDEDEIVVLNWIVEKINKAYSTNTNRIFAGHNIAGFDIPFLIKRLIKHRIKIPTLLKSILEDKPWDQKIIDTIRVWKFGSTEFVALATICGFLGIPTPKTGDVTGVNLNDFYYGDDPDKIKKIVNYNKADVVAVEKVVWELAFL